MTMGTWWAVLAWALIAVAAWVRRLPALASKSTVLTLWVHCVQLNFMPPLMRWIL